MNLQEELDYCSQCEARLEYLDGALICPNCRWEGSAEEVMRYEQSHGYEPGSKSP